MRKGRGGAGRGKPPSASSRCARRTRTSPRGRAAINARSVAARVQRSGCSASARVGRQLTERRPPSARPPARPLLCFATLPPGTTRGRARRTPGWRRDAGLTGHGSLSYSQPLAPSDGTPSPNGLWRPARLRRRRHDPGTTAPHLPECRLKGGPCAPLGKDPSGRLQDQRGAAAQKLSPCHARPWATVLSSGWDTTPVHFQSPAFTLAKTEQLCQEHEGTNNRHFPSSQIRGAAVRIMENRLASPPACRGPGSPRTVPPWRFSLEWWF